jgi:cysteine desulfurase
MLYLDYCATTPIHDEVVEVIADVMRKHYGNPSSLHRLGFEAEQLVKQSRQVIADILRCQPTEIIFTSGGTESNNLAIKGTAFAQIHRGKHLITSQIEHSSVIESFLQLEKQGFRVTYLPVDGTGQVQIDHVQNAIENDTVLVSLMQVNNEMGRIQPIAEIGSLLTLYPKIIFHVDSIQSVGKLQVTPSQLGADLLSVSAHKLYGPKGIGLLYRRHGISLTPQQSGGGQEFDVRSGTENVPLIVGMAKALFMIAEQQQEQTTAMYRLRTRLMRRMEQIEGLVITGSTLMTEMAPHIVHFCIPGLRAEVVVHALEQHEIYISTRSACASDEAKPSRTLLAMGMDHEQAASGLRVSYSAAQSLEEMDYFADKLQQVIKELRKYKPMIKTQQSKRRR